MAGIRDIISDNIQPKKTTKKPKGYADTAALLKEMHSRYTEALKFNQDNIEEGKEDARFVAGDQWDHEVRQRRRRKNRPVLTFNRLNAFVAQLIGNRLMNETEIRVLPDKSGTKAIASLREGIIRSIYKNSQARFARDEAYKYQVIGGQGAFALRVAYSDDDVFEQDIKIEPIVDPYSVVFDPAGIEPSGEDCQYVFVCDTISKSEFLHRYPDAEPVSFAENSESSSSFWGGKDEVTIVSYWQMVVEGKKVLALFNDGTTHDVTDKPYETWSQQVAIRQDGTPYIREVPKRFARLYICSKDTILEGPYDYPISSIPVYRVSGWEVNDGERTHRWGLIRFLKDPQKLHNFWRSAIAERLVAAPRNKWVATPESVRGFENAWRNASSSDDALLFYNDDYTPPQEIPPPSADAALINEAGLASQDLKDISNLHEAALGMPSNEVSGAAIQARQSVSDIGTYIFTDRLRLADLRCAKNINELIPYIYDTYRTVSIMGSDDKSTLAVINNPMDPESDVTLGKYAVSVEVGPATQTKRILAAEQMMTFVNAAPQVAASVMDLIAGAQDWPEAEEFARRFRAMLPPGLVPPDDMSPEMQQQQQQAQQQQQLQQQIQQQQTAAKIKLDLARAMQAEAHAQKQQVDAISRQHDVASKSNFRDVQASIEISNQEHRHAIEKLEAELLWHKNMLNGM